MLLSFPAAGAAATHISDSLKHRARVSTHINDTFAWSSTVFTLVANSTKPAKYTSASMLVIWSMSFSTLYSKVLLLCTQLYSKQSSPVLVYVLLLVYGTLCKLSTNVKRRHTSNIGPRQVQKGGHQHLWRIHQPSTRKRRRREDKDAIDLLMLLLLLLLLLLLFK